MKRAKSSKIKKVLGKYNYWRSSLKDVFFAEKRDKKASSSCQVACYSDPCQADPTCDFD